MPSTKQTSDQEKLTSVKVDVNLYNDFKMSCLQSNFSLKKLVDKAMFLYINDNTFKEKLHSTNPKND